MKYSISTYYIDGYWILAHNYYYGSNKTNNKDGRGELILKLEVLTSKHKLQTELGMFHS